MGRQRFSDEDDDRDERPRDRRDDDDEDDDRPRRRDRRDEEDDYDDRPRRPLAKPGLATAAGVLWVIWGGLGCIMLIINIIALMDNGPRRAAGSTLGNIIGILLLIGGIVICLLAGIRTLNGSVSSIRVFGILSLIYCIAYVVLTTVLVALAAAVLGGAAGAPAGFAVGLVIGACVVTVLIVSGMLLASIFAMTSSKRYKLWWRAARERSRRDY
jgi:hypothetical protein